MPLDITYLTSGAWGPGIGILLEDYQVDTNFWNIQQAIEALQNDRPQPNGIANITTSNAFWIVTLDDGKVLETPIAIVKFNWIGDWQPFFIFKALDAFKVTGVGIYDVNVDHIASAVFDELEIRDGHAVYNKLFGADVGAVSAADQIYDVETCYQGKLSDSPIDLLFEFIMLRHGTLPVAATHRAYLHVPPSTAIQVLPIYHNDAQIGSITFGIGASDGVFAFAVGDADLPAGDRIGIGKPPAADATAQTLTVAFALSRLIP